MKDCPSARAFIAASDGNGYTTTTTPITAGAKSASPTVLGTGAKSS